MKNSFLSSFLFFSLFFSSCSSQLGTWSQLNISISPPIRTDATAIYVSSSNSMLIFGGSTNFNTGYDLNDLWSYNIGSNSWVQLNVSNPPPARDTHTAVYVSSSNSMLIFAGENGAVLLNDLWSYNISSNSWVQLNATNPPSARDGHTAIYIPSSNSMLIFGGYNGAVLLNDLWSYNIGSNSWVQLNATNPPSVRDGHTAIYIPSSNSMLIFGGYNGAALNDLWSYNIGSNSWVQLNASNPPPSRDFHSAIYASVLNSMLIFGGINSGGSADYNDLWSYNIGSNSWVQLNASNPPPSRDSHTAIYVPSSNSMFIFAGEDIYGTTHNDLWDYATPLQTTSQQITGQQTTSQQITGLQTTGSSNPASEGMCVQISIFLTFLLLLFI